jgi:hypothetical protein
MNIAPVVVTARRWNERWRRGGGMRDGVEEVECRENSSANRLRVIVWCVLPVAGGRDWWVIGCSGCSGWWVGCWLVDG